MLPSKEVGGQSPVSQPKPDYRSGIRFALELGGFQLVTGLEYFRGELVNLKVFGNLLEQSQRSTLLNPDTTNPIIYQTLQSSGDFYDGYTLSFFLYTAITIADHIQSVITKHKVPYKYKLGTTVALISAVVPVIESGILGVHNTADYGDIPAGLLGILAYTGVHLLGRRFEGK